MVSRLGSPISRTCLVISVLRLVGEGIHRFRCQRLTGRTLSETIGDNLVVTARVGIRWRAIVGTETDARPNPLRERDPC